MPLGGSIMEFGRDVRLHPAAVLVILIAVEHTPAGALASVLGGAGVDAQVKGGGRGAAQVVRLALAVVAAAVFDEPLARVAAGVECAVLRRALNGVGRRGWRGAGLSRCRADGG